MWPLLPEAAHVTTLPPLAAPPPAGLAAAPRPQRCIVVLHHKCQTQWLPPGVGRLLRGHLLKAHLQNLEDLLAHFGGGGK